MAQVAEVLTNCQVHDRKSRREDVTTIFNGLK
jgi:hypothetical protein